MPRTEGKSRIQIHQGRAGTGLIKGYITREHMKDLILNRGERYKDIDDLCSYLHNLHVSSCEINSGKI